MKPQVTIHYQVEFIEEFGVCNGTKHNAAPVTLNVPYFITVLDVMKMIVEQDKDFTVRFTAEYYGTQNGSYHITSVNGKNEAFPCVWSIYVRSPDGTEVKPEVGIAAFIPPPNSTVILRYEHYHGSSVINVTYGIDYIFPVCSNATGPKAVNVTVPPGSSVLTVMERAVDTFGSDYSFVAEYQQDTGIGHNILGINGTMNSPHPVFMDISCYWIYRIYTPSGGYQVPSVKVDFYYFPSNGYTVRLVYAAMAPPNLMNKKSS